MDKYEKSFLEEICTYLISEKEHFDNQIYIINNRFNDKAWAYEKNYLKYELGIVTKKRNYVTYLLTTTQETLHKIDKFSFVNYASKHEPEQLKL